MAAPEPLPNVEQFCVKVRKHTYVFLINPDGASYTKWPRGLTSRRRRVYVHLCNVPYKNMEHPLFYDPQHVGIGHEGIVTVTALGVRARPWTFNSTNFLQDIAGTLMMLAGLELDEFLELQQKIITAVNEISDRTVKQLPNLRMHRAFMMKMHENGGETPKHLPLPQPCERLPIACLMPDEFWLLHAQWAEWADLYYNGTAPRGAPLDTAPDDGDVTVFEEDLERSPTFPTHPGFGTLYPSVGILPSPPATDDGNDDWINPMAAAVDLDGSTDGLLDDEEDEESRGRATRDGSADSGWPAGSERFGEMAWSPACE